MSAQDLQDLRRKVANLLAVPSLYAYGRVLSLVEEYAERAAAYPADPFAAHLLQACNTYHLLCGRAVRELTARAATFEHKSYERRRSDDGSSTASVSASASASSSGSGSEQERKRGGVVLDVYNGEHIVAALDALRLEEFLEEQEQEQEPAPVVNEKKKVRFSC
ncbi:hypothetical protein F5X97DRAFT_116252 [Nemania serpens]|nr:hypothetical protein F5X97DRAFT_116252 [Nemania serpens]